MELMSLIVCGIFCLVCLLFALHWRKAYRRMKESDHTKGTFLRHLSSGIRTPLHSVCGLAEVIAKEDVYLSKEEKKTISDQIINNVSMISTQLEEMMVFALGSAGHPIYHERLNINMLCLRCVELFKETKMMKEGVKMLYDKELSEDCFVSSDGHLLELVIGKLLGLACRFTEKGQIVLTARLDGDKLIISVSDTGGGIPVKRYAKLFDWFDEPDEGRDEAELELSIVQKIVNKLGGYVNWDRTYTEGTKVEIVLPA